MDQIPVLLTLPFPDVQVERLRAVSPRLRIEMRPVRDVAAIPADLLNEIEVLYTARMLPEPDSVPNLRWIQLHFAGADHMIDHPLIRSGVAVTTLSGAAVPQMAEFVLMSMLALGQRLDRMFADKAKKHWSDQRFDRFQPQLMRGSTVGIVGYGSVGREVARMAKAMGAHVLAAKRDLMDLEDHGYMPEGMGDRMAEIPDRLYPPEALRSMASVCDFVVITVPLTPKTRGLVGKAVLQAMKPSAFLMDVSRGGVVDHGALVEALNEKKIAGAALDVYPLEPLPQSSPLWELPNVILSPHVAGAAQNYYEQAATLFAENLRRYVEESPLLNLVEPERGY
jgi:phosphoglycerate dehydrogenase-like enzyme